MNLRNLVHRWAAAGGATVVVGTASLALTIGGPTLEAGALPPALAASTTQLDFHEATLGTYVGPLDVTLTNTSASSDHVTGYEFSGGNDFVFDNVQDQCSQTLAPGGSCLLEFDFLPGALGTRTLTLTVLDTANSGLTISMTGVGGIGYYQVDAQGAIGYAGDAAYYGDAQNLPLNHPVVGIAPTGDDGGYFLVASDGGVFAYGNANFFGSPAGHPLNEPVVDMVVNHNANGGSGYWMVASDGGIFAYGDAQFYGSTGGMQLNRPIVGMATTRDGNGYWLVASDGGIFAYGDAQFYGSTGGMQLNRPIVGMAPTPDGGGYWLVASDGGIFAYGDAQFYGSTGSIALNQPIVGMAVMPDGGGYWFTAADGGLFNYGTAPFDGSGAGFGFGEVVGMATDGVPTYQAATDQPALRPLRPLRPDDRYAGPMPGMPRLARR